MMVIVVPARHSARMLRAQSTTLFHTVAGAVSLQRNCNRLARHFFILGVLARLAVLTAVLAFLAVRFFPVFSVGTLR
jgi:hypothetical protein